MGKPMALNILKAGFPLTVFNRTAEKAGELLTAGARWADSPPIWQDARTLSSQSVQHRGCVVVVLGQSGVREAQAWDDFCGQLHH